MSELIGRVLRAGGLMDTTTLHMGDITAKILMESNPGVPVTLEGWQRFLNEKGPALGACIEAAQSEFLAEEILGAAMRGESFFRDDELCSS